MLPEMGYTFDYPDVLNDTQGVKRLHNKVGKDALRTELINHHRRRIPKHFQTTARSAYGHMPRREKYKAYKYKRFRSRTDLVRTGATRDAMTKGYQLQMGGTASGEFGLRGKLILRFPFSQSVQKSQAKKATLFGPSTPNRSNNRAGVTIDQMRKEISTITSDEQNEIAKNLGDNYAKGLQTELKNRPRIKKYFK